MTVTDMDDHAQHGFMSTRVAITDRWGPYREFAVDGGMLCARICHGMRGKGGCDKHLQSNGCGCACPYMYTRSSKLGKRFTAVARGNVDKTVKAWDRLIAHKDGQGRLLLNGLPYVDGFAVNASTWETIDPSRQAPKKHQRQTPEEDRRTVHAFDRETAHNARQVQRSVKEAFDRMKTFS